MKPIHIYFDTSNFMRDDSVCKQFFYDYSEVDFYMESFSDWWPTGEKYYKRLLFVKVKNSDLVFEILFKTHASADDIIKSIKKGESLYLREDYSNIEKVTNNKPRSISIETKDIKLVDDFKEFIIGSLKAETWKPRNDFMTITERQGSESDHRIQLDMLLDLFKKKHHIKD